MSQSTSDLELLLAGLRGDDKEEGGLSEILAALILKKNRENTFRFLITPYAERVVLLPQCLRSTTACQAEERDGEYICKGCGACKIAEITRRANELGYLGTRVLKGGSAIPRLIKETQAKAVLGIACPIEGALGIMVCEHAGVPVFCVPLLRAGCADTDVDLDDVRSALEAMAS